MGDMSDLRQGFAITQPRYRITTREISKIAPLLLISRASESRFSPMMTRFAPATLIAALMLAGPAAACTVKYKAKQDNPLKLEVGTAELPAEACGSEGAAAAALAPILAAKGWTLLAIVAIQQ